MVKSINNTKIIVTLGPSSLNSKTIKDLKKDVDIFRLNMSHLTLKQLKDNLVFLKKNKIKNICLDTEGSQVRTLFTKKKIFLKQNKKIKISSVENLNKEHLKLYPSFSFKNVVINSKIKIGFDGLKIKVIKKEKNYIKCKVISSGFIESNKGVHFESDIKLDPLTKKDLEAIKLAKSLGVKIFALSFANTASDVKLIRSLIGKKDELISKIESKKGFLNRKEIIKSSDAILIDRGDLSRYINISKIPLAQRIIFNDVKKNKVKAYVATNLLETMISSSEPTRAESNDIFSCIENGCSGLVLAAETAIGKNPAKCVSFLKECINVYNKKFKFLKKNNYFFNNEI